MPNQKVFDFDQLSNSDLSVDALYKGGKKRNAGDDPINKLVGCGNQGGFRYIGTANEPKLCILYSDLLQADWPDEIDDEFGLFIYYGDNRKPGHALEDTTRKGNLILRNVFNNLHTGRRDLIPPFLIFTKGAEGRDVIFRGLAVPGAIGIDQTEDLIALWKVAKDRRFQNYKAIFTILDISLVQREWINSIRGESSHTINAPKAWMDWREKKTIRL